MNCLQHVLMAVKCIKHLSDAGLPSKVPASHGTAVCDGGECDHKDGGCLVQQPTEEEVSPYCVAYQETENGYVNKRISCTVSAFIRN